MATVCTFVGTAALTSVSGSGAAVFFEADAFSEGHAQRVVLDGVIVGPVGAQRLDVERPKSLVPVGMNANGARFEVTYKAGLPIEIVVIKGGGPGLFIGNYDGGSFCDSPATANGNVDCPLHWAKDTKTTVLYRADATRLPLSGNLRVQPDPQMANPPSIEIIVLEGARGTLTCVAGGATANKIDNERLTWTNDSDTTLSLKPLEVEGNDIHVHIESRTPPKRETVASVMPPPPPPTWLYAVLVVACGLAVVVGTHVRRKNRTSGPTSPEPQADKKDARATPDTQDSHHAVPIPIASTSTTSPIPTKSADLAAVMVAKGNDSTASEQVGESQSKSRQTGYHPRDITELAPMTRNELLDGLCHKLNATELDQLATKFGIPDAVLPSKYASHGDRAIAVLKWVEARNRTAELKQLYGEILGIPDPQ